MSLARAEHHDDCICPACQRARQIADQAIKAALGRADAEIAKRGIPGRPTVRPSFTDTTGKNCERWVTENVRELFDWYHATIGANPDDESWPIFCAEQFYQQQTTEQLLGEWRSTLTTPN